jgi:hypothetical protein
MHAAHLPTKSHGVSQEAGVEVPYHLSGGETGHRPHTPCPDNIDLSIGFCLLFPALERLTRFHDEIVVGRGDVQHIVPEQGERHRSAAVDAHGVRFELERFPGDKVDRPAFDHEGGARSSPLSRASLGGSPFHSTSFRAPSPSGCLLASAFLGSSPILCACSTDRLGGSCHDLLLSAGTYPLT